jgi:hypothetical protein
MLDFRPLSSLCAHDPRFRFDSRQRREGRGSYQSLSREVSVSAVHRLRDANQSLYADENLLSRS